MGGGGRAGVMRLQARGPRSCRPPAGAGEGPGATSPSGGPGPADASTGRIWHPAQRRDRLVLVGPPVPGAPSGSPRTPDTPSLGTACVPHTPSHCRLGQPATQSPLRPPVCRGGHGTGGSPGAAPPTRLRWPHSLPAPAACAEVIEEQAQRGGDISPDSGPQGHRGAPEEAPRGGRQGRGAGAGWPCPGQLTRHQKLFLQEKQLGSFPDAARTPRPHRPGLRTEGAGQGGTASPGMTLAGRGKGLLCCRS